MDNRSVLLVLCFIHLPHLVLATSQPNVVFVLADDYGYNDVGYHNSDMITPNLDKLASSGVKLENYYVQPICTPTRSQLMSGRYQIHTGLQHSVIRPEQPNALPLNSPTMADKMKESGYATHMIGKWHLGFYKDEYLPWNRGFDTFFGFLIGAEDYYHHTRSYEHSGRGYLDLRNEHGIVRNETNHYSSHLFTQKTIDIINGHDGEKPLFIYLAYQSVHTPMQVPKRYENMYKHIKNRKRRVYSGMVTAMDEGIGKVTDALKSKGIWDNTVFIFSTDNGGTPAGGGNNYPLRGNKGSLWEGGVHGVGFVAGGHLSPSQSGKVNKELIHVSDWYPTLVTLAGGHFNGCLPLDGRDQWDTINSGAKSKRSVLLHNIDPLHGRSGKPLYPDLFDTSVQAAVRAGRYKLLTGNPGYGGWAPPPSSHHDNDVDDASGDDGGDEDGSDAYTSDTLNVTKNVWLYDIEADPNEHHDLSETRPGIVRSLLRLLTKINATAVAPVFPPHDPNSNPALHGNVWGPWQ